jgi:hypothetical protein
MCVENVKGGLNLSGIGLVRNTLHRDLWMTFSLCSPKLAAGTTWGGLANVGGPATAGLRDSEGSGRCSSAAIPRAVRAVEAALSMPPRKLTPVQVLERLLTRLEKRMEALRRVKLDGFEMVISELEVEQDYLRRAMRYLEE